MAELSIEQKRALAMAAARARAASTSEQPNERTFAPQGAQSSLPEHSAMYDMAASAAVAPVKAVVNTAIGLPVVARNALRGAFDYGTDAAQYGIVNGAKTVWNAVAPEDKQAVPTSWDSIRESTAKRNAEMDAKDPVKMVLGAINDKLYQPRGIAGKATDILVQTALPGGLISKEATLAGKVLNGFETAIAPTAGALAGGEVGKIYGNEELGTALGGILGSVGGAKIYSEMGGGGPRRILAEKLNGTTPEQWQTAREALQGTRNQGINTSLANVLDTATNDVAGMGELQRTLERTPFAASTIRSQFEPVPGQVVGATQRVLDGIAPAPTETAHVLGPRAADAASRAITTERQAINATTADQFAEAAPKQLPMEALADPRFENMLKSVRQRFPELGSYADNSVEVVSKVAGELRDAGVAAKNSTNSTYSNFESALNHSAAGKLDEVLKSDAAAPYSDAMATQAALRRSKLDPLTAGPLGSIANSNTLESVLQQIFNPIYQDKGAVADALTRIGKQEPGLNNALVRQGIGQSLNDAQKRVMSGQRQNVGSVLSNDLAGTPAKEESLLKVIAGSGGNVKPDQFKEYIDALRMTGKRLPMGSATASDATTMKMLGSGGIGAAGAEAAASRGGFMTVAKDILDRVILTRNGNTLAKLLTDTSPEGLAALEKISTDPKFNQSLAQMFATGTIKGGMAGAAAQGWNSNQ